MPAGTVVLLASPSHAATTGTADYAAEFVRASGRLRSAFMGGWVNVMHGIPFLLGGTKNTAAIRTLAEIEQWVTCTGSNNDDISATRKAFMASLRTTEHTQQYSASCISALHREVVFFVCGFRQPQNGSRPTG
jgi:hypothetical protein